MGRLKKLAYEDWLNLCNVLDNTRDPYMLYTATGDHYVLMNFLRSLGIRAVGRTSAYDIGRKLVNAKVAYEAKPKLGGKPFME